MAKLLSNAPKVNLRANVPYRGLSVPKRELGLLWDTRKEGKEELTSSFKRLNLELKAKK